MDLTKYNKFRLSAKEVTEQKWQLDIEARAQAAQDKVDWENAQKDMPPKKLLTAPKLHL